MRYPIHKLTSIHQANPLNFRIFGSRGVFQCWSNICPNRLLYNKPSGSKSLHNIDMFNYTKFRRHMTPKFSSRWKVSNFYKCFLILFFRHRLSKLIKKVNAILKIVWHCCWWIWKLSNIPKYWLLNYFQFLSDLFLSMS